MKFNSTEKLCKNSEDYIDYDYNEERPVFLSYKLPSLFMLLLSCFLCMISAIVSAISLSHFTKEFNLSDNSQLLEYYIAISIFYISVFFTIWYMADFSLMYYLYKFKKEYKIGFVSLALIHNNWLIKTIITIFTYASILGLIIGLKNKKILGRNKNSYDNEKVSDRNIQDSDEISNKVDQDEILEDNYILFEKTIFEIRKYKLVFYMFLFGILVSISLIQKIIIQFLNYKIHQEHYSDKINKNNEVMACLYKLGKHSKRNSNMDLKTYANNIFSSILRPGLSELDVYDFINMYGEKEGRDLFTLFDENIDNTVSKDEFVEKYCAFYYEKQLLTESLLDNNNTTKKLRSILFIFFFPIIILVILSIIGKAHTFKGGFKKVLVLILPLSFIFKASIIDVFHSIVYIYCVRPFDLGDVITLDDKIYEVADIGLLFTTLISNGRHFNFPNETLRKKVVVNLCRSGFVTESYEQQYNYESFHDKKELFCQNISSFLKKNSKKYDMAFDINNYRFERGKILKVTIKIYLKCKYTDILCINEKKDDFTIFLKDTVDKLGLI